MYPPQPLDVRDHHRLRNPLTKPRMDFNSLEQ